VATLWKIASASTSELMVGFHQELAKRRGGSFAKAQALRAAQLRFIRDARRRHPYYWSPFVLVGSPR
jgi:CHAT domain-containing protein